MTVNQTLVDLIHDLLDDVGTISVRRMFGGAGVYCDGHVFAFLADDVMYLKVDDDTRPAFIAEGMGPFVFESKKGTTEVSSYYRAPERLFDEPDDMRDWVRRAVAITRRQAAQKEKPRRAAKAKAPPKRTSPTKRKRPAKEAKP